MSGLWAPNNPWREDNLAPARCTAGKDLPNRPSGLLMVRTPTEEGEPALKLSSNPHMFAETPVPSIAMTVVVMMMMMMILNVI